MCQLIAPTAACQADSGRQFTGSNTGWKIPPSHPLKQSFGIAQSLPSNSVQTGGQVNRPIALTSQILGVSSGCCLTISVRVQQPHTDKKLTILIQNYYKDLQNFLCLQKLYYA